MHKRRVGCRGVCVCETERRRVKLMNGNVCEVHGGDDTRRGLEDDVRLFESRKRAAAGAVARSAPQQQDSFLRGILPHQPQANLRTPGGQIQGEVRPSDRPTVRSSDRLTV